MGLFSCGLTISVAPPVGGEPTGGLKISSLLFEDDVILLTSSGEELQAHTGAVCSQV